MEILIVALLLGFVLAASLQARTIPAEVDHPTKSFVDVSSCAEEIKKYAAFYSLDNSMDIDAEELLAMGRNIDPELMEAIEQVLSFYEKEGTAVVSNEQDIHRHVTLIKSVYRKQNRSMKRQYTVKVGEADAEAAA